MSYMNIGELLELSTISEKIQLAKTELSTEELVAQATKDIVEDGLRPADADVVKATKSLQELNALRKQIPAECDEALKAVDKKIKDLVSQIKVKLE